MREQPSSADLDTFRDLLSSTLGFRFEDARLASLAELLAARLVQTDMASAPSYFDYLAHTPEEVTALAREVTVSETYFFRNRGHFRALEALLRDRAASPRRELRLLSAGCSSGEEAYSLAIMLRETLTRIDSWNISILGVDVNADVVDLAHEASYAEWALRATPVDLRAKYFRKDGTRFVLSEQLRDMVRFEVGNLLQADDTRLWRRGTFDIIFCRNVLMYFTPQAAQGLVASIARSLTPDGYLFVGHAESLRGASQEFHLCHTHETFYYRRRRTLADSRNHNVATPPVPIRTSLNLTRQPPRLRATEDAPWFEAIAQASSRIEKLAGATSSSESPAHATSSGAPEQNTAPEQVADKDLKAAISLMRQERFQEALRLLVASSTRAEPCADEQLLRAMLLASTGKMESAERLCHELLGVDELNAGAHYVVAICREHACDPEAAIAHSRSATYLDPEFAMPHLQLGRLARREGQLSMARRELTLALSLLAREDAARIALFGGGFGRDVLIQLCRAELAACGEAT